MSESGSTGAYSGLAGPDQGEAQGEAAASRSGQGSLDGTAPAPGPANPNGASGTEDTIFGAAPMPQPPTSRCRHTKAPTDYAAWYEWAEAKSKTHRQERCPVCGLWAIWKRKPKVAT